jgi:uncharacterized protein (DUF736 family)
MSIAIEAATGAGSKAKRSNDMATIGTFKKSANEYVGEIVTLSVQAKNVRIIQEEDRANDKAPSHRAVVGSADYAENGIMRSARS